MWPQRPSICVRTGQDRSRGQTDRKTDSDAGKLSALPMKWAYYSTLKSSLKCFLFVRVQFFKKKVTVAGNSNIISF